MREYFLELSIELDNRLEIVKNEQPKNYMSMSVVIVESALEKLKKFIAKNSFKSIQDEIYYFKHLKPSIYSHLIYFKKRNQIELQMPQGSCDEKKGYLDKELKCLTRYSKTNTVFFQYIRSGKTDLDLTYFLREEAKAQPIFESFACDMDYQYCTGYDYRVSVIIAHEKLEKYLNDKITILNNPHLEISNVENTAYDCIYESGNLKWTCTQSALSELVYGLYHERVFNHGNAEIKEIAGLLEKAFKIKIPNVYRTFSDVKNRKGGELKFIKSMANKIDVEINNNFK